MKKIARDWWKQDSKYKPAPAVKINDIIADEINRIEDLPQLIPAAEAAKKLNVSLTTINRMFSRGDLGTLKIGHKRFTTPGFIAFYLEQQIRKNA